MPRFAIVADMNRPNTLLRIVACLICISFAQKSAHAGIQLIRKERKDDSILLYVRFKNRLIQLPERTLYTKILYGNKKEICAVNFHEVTTYNDADIDADIIVQDEGKLRIVTQIWRKIEEKAYARNVLPNWHFDHVDLQVKNIRGNKVYCRFYGASHWKRKECLKYFSLRVTPTKDGIRLRTGQVNWFLQGNFPIN